MSNRASWRAAVSCWRRCSACFDVFYFVCLLITSPRLTAHKRFATWKRRDVKSYAVDYGKRKRAACYHRQAAKAAIEVAICNAATFDQPKSFNCVRAIVQI